MAAGGGSLWAARKSPRRGRSADSDSDDAEARKARARDADREEKEAFEERLRARDVSKTRRLGGDGRVLDDSSAAKKKRSAAEAASAASDDLDASDLRKVSREEYLKKRERQKLDELKDSIEDEKYLFEGTELTAAEKRDIEYRQGVRTRDAADSRHRRGDGGSVSASRELRRSRHRGPRREVPGGKARYKPDADADLNPNREHGEAPGDEGGAQVRARDRGVRAKYEYVFEDQIAFVTDEIWGERVDFFFFRRGFGFGFFRRRLRR